MTNCIPITTPTIKVNRCNKGTNYHQKQNYCSASLKHTHTTHAYVRACTPCNQILKHTTHIHTHKHTHTHTHSHARTHTHTHAHTHTNTHTHTHTHTRTHTHTHTDVHTYGDDDANVNNDSKKNDKYSKYSDNNNSCRSRYHCSNEINHDTERHNSGFTHSSHIEKLMCEAPEAEGEATVKHLRLRVKLQWSTWGWRWSYSEAPETEGEATVKHLRLKVKHLRLRVKHLRLRVKHLRLRVKHLRLRVKLERNTWGWRWSYGEAPETEGEATVKHLRLKVKHLRLRVKHLRLRVKLGWSTWDWGWS